MNLDDVFHGYDPDPDNDPVTLHWRQAAGKTLYHDFKDGNGPVQAHRHLNSTKGYGGLGGWVANTAYVHADAYIDESAEVSEKAYIGKQVWLQRGSKVCGEAYISGPVILGNHVRFGSFAQARYSCRIKHPIYIGYSPLLTGRRLGFDTQGNAKYLDDQALPELTIERHHPIVNRWLEKGVLHTMVMLDDAIVFDKVRRGHRAIVDFNDGRDNMFGPHFMPTKSWKESAHIEAIVCQSINELGLPPRIIDGIALWPEREDLMERLGGMPNTVAHAKLYMKH